MFEKLKLLKTILFFSFLLPWISSCVSAPFQWSEIKYNKEADKQKEEISRLFTEDVLKADKEKAASAEKGELDFISAAWFIDQENPLSKAFNCDASVILVPALEKPWTSGPLTIKSHQRVIFQEGCKIELKKSEENTFIIIDNSEDIEISAYHCQFVYNSKTEEEKTNPPDFLRINKSRMINLGGAEITGFAKGISIGQKCESLSFKDLQITNNRQEGLHIESGRLITIEHCLIRENDSTGILIEPLGPEAVLEKIEINGNTIRNNKGGFELAVDKMTTKSVPMSFFFRNNTIKSNGFWNIFCHEDKDAPAATLIFQSNSIGLFRRFNRIGRYDIVIY